MPVKVCNWTWRNTIPSHAALTDQNPSRYSIARVFIWPWDEPLLRIRIKGKHSHFVQGSEIPKKIQQCYDTGERSSVFRASFLRIYRTISPTFCAVIRTFLLEKRPLANDSDKYGEKLTCMYYSCNKHETNSSITALWLSRKRKKQAFFWQESEGQNYSELLLFS